MTTQLSLKTEVNLKDAAKKKAAEQGVTLTLVINKFLEKYAEGDFEFELVQTNDTDVTMDELFRSKKIVKAANEFSNYLSNKKL